MSETSDIIREARKAGMQTAIMLFAALVLVLIAFHDKAKRYFLAMCD